MASLPSEPPRLDPRAMLDRAGPHAAIDPPSQRALPVLLNQGANEVRRAGAKAMQARVVQACEAAGVTAQVELLPAELIGAAVERAVAAGARTVVVGGGDGTLRTAAQVLADTDVTLGVLPLGNLNHFARDLGLPSDLEGALRVVNDGHVRQVDLGDLGGTIFINNATLGMYPHMVRVREQHERLRWSRFFAMIRASWTTLMRFPILRLHIHEPEEIGELRSPLVFVGVNEYELGPGSGPRRRRMDGGKLFLCAAKPTSRLRFVWLCMRSWFSSTSRPDDLLRMLVQQAEITTPRERAWVGLDGEVLRFYGRLDYRVRPGALRVLAPVSPEPAPPGQLGAA